MRKRLYLLILLLFASPALSGAEEDSEKPASRQVERKLRMPKLFTIGAWSQTAELDGYRIEQNRITRHYRLLDPSNIRICSGSLDKCQEAMARELEQGPTVEYINIVFPTLGGKQYWGDVLIYGGWRIQQNVFTKHYRLLDADDVRRAWGNYAQCERALSKARAAGEAKLSSRRLVILLHGIFRSRDSFKKMRKALEAEGYQVYGVNYPSSQQSIEEHVELVGRLISNIERDFDEINIVTHSLGGLVARGLLAHGSNPKYRRIVMLAPPNQGAILADKLMGWWPVRKIYGPTGDQLVTSAESYAATVGIPRCEFGIIAASRGRMNNPIIPGDDDSVVSVQNTRLEGMTDHIILSGDHTFIMDKAEVIRQTLEFLKHGKFDHPLIREKQHGARFRKEHQNRRDQPQGSP